MLADAGSRGLIRPSTDDYHFSRSSYDKVVAPLSGPLGYTVESHASVSGDNCRSPRWGHRFQPFATFQFASEDDVLINMPFSIIVKETRHLQVHQRATSFAFTYVLPVGAPSVQSALPELLARLSAMGASCRHTFKPGELIFVGRKTTYIFPDRSPGFAPPLPLRWPVCLWRKD